MAITPTMRIALCLAAAFGTIALLASRSEDAHSRDADAVKASSTRAPLEPVLKPAPSTPIAEEKAQLGDEETWQSDWDGIVEKALTPELLSASAGNGMKQFCPRFQSMSQADKRAYWAYLFQALSGAESGLRAVSNVQHTEPEVAVKDRVSHRMVRSQGLLQLTYQDAARYGCDFDWNSDRNLNEHDPDKTILRPKNNLECGVKILQRQLIDHQRPLLSKVSYWSVLRPGWPGNQVFLKQMSNVPEACGRRLMPRKPESKSNSSLSVGASR